VQNRLGAVLRLDDHVGLGEARVDVAPLVAARLVHERLAANGLLGVEQRLELLPLHVDERKRLAGPLVALGGDGGHRRAVEGRLGLQHVALVRPDCAQHAGQLERTAEVELVHARARVG
jgi:hypothetical protein